MKPQIIAMLLVSGLTGEVKAAQNVTVSFTAELLSGTCDVSVAGNGSDATIILPTLTADELNEKKVAGYTPFTITLANCFGTLPMARVYFEKGPNVDSTFGYLKNNGGTATNANFSLLNTDGSIVDIGSDTQPYIDISAGTGTQNFQVAYTNNYVSGKATGGTVISSVTYHIDYK
ncbi:fimbrial protein [Klebsiella aerogenes]|uniref:fimbrial protein n=1 Tax=Klebsiella aerogenes TaxID=548 RepID=UPI00244686CE|nr:type 1 fimbrial protein [Klebsiella aerogenes]MDH1612396.1 type 1 fimbrial protein [Klebsiella aerogenes]